MKQFNKMLCRCLLIFCIVLLGGCGYASSPGLVVETKQYPLEDNATLIVTRHLDDWRTGSLFTFEWYVAKCRSSSGLQTILMQDMVLRGTYSSDIPNERIRITDDKVGYAYFNEIVVFDKGCNKISHFDPWRTYVIKHSAMRPNYRIESAKIEKSGHGYVRISWELKEGGVRNLIFRTNDFGVHWLLPDSDIDVREEIRVEAPTDNSEAEAASIASLREVSDKLENSEYVVEKGHLARRPQVAASTSTSLTHDQEFQVLSKCLEFAKDRGIGQDGDRVIIVDRKEYYEIFIGNPTVLRARVPPTAYVGKVLVNKRATGLAQWLSTTASPPAGNDVSANR